MKPREIKRLIRRYESSVKRTHRYAALCTERGYPGRAAQTLRGIPALEEQLERLRAQLKGE